MKKPVAPPDLPALLRQTKSDRLGTLLDPRHRQGVSKYFHWDELRRRPLPGDLTHEEWWLAIKLGRSMLQRPIPLKDTQGNGFNYSLADPILEKLPFVDGLATGTIGLPENILNSDQRDRYIVSSLMEEAITSSQLEGAATTRKDAIEMLRSGRSPRDRSEQMIVNNYRAMREIITLKDKIITPERLCELHRIVTENTLDNPDAAGRIQLPGERRVAVWDEQDGQILHQPPSAIELPQRMQALCDFANAPQQEGQFLHPVIRAIILHFWLAYDHPFEDGNGRTARALFYWSMVRQGYWLFEFISISSLIKKAPASYARAFLFTETDDNDLSYFIIHQINIIVRAIHALRDYLERKTGEIRDVSKRLHNLHTLNHRQKALIAHALKNPQAVYSIESHRNSHNTAYATSRADLLHLHELGLLKQFKVGKGLRFQPAETLEQQLGEVT